MNTGRPARSHTCSNGAIRSTAAGVEKAVAGSCRPTNPLSSSTVSPSTSGSMTLVEAQAVNGAGSWRTPSCQASSSGWAWFGGSDSIPSGLDMDSTMRSVPGSSAARAAGSCTVGSM